MSINRRHVRAYIEHFLRYSQSIYFKNISLALAAGLGVEIFNQHANTLIEATTQRHLSDLFILEGNIADLCLNYTHFNKDRRVAREILRAFNFGYMEIINGPAEKYTPYFAQKFIADSCENVFSMADLAIIDNTMRLLSYGLIIKYLINAIPPFMPEALDIDTTLLRSLMLNQKEAPYFSEIISQMLTNLGFHEEDLETGLKKVGVWIKSPFTQGSILFPLTTSAGRSYDVGDLSALQANKFDPITRQSLTGIYYNKTLFSMIYHGIQTILNQQAQIPNEKKTAFMQQLQRIHQSLQKKLHEKPLISNTAQKKEISLFSIVSFMMAGFFSLSRVFLPIFIPFACRLELGEWQNPLPQLCADFVSALQLTTKGFHGAFDYGIKSATQCLEEHTKDACNTKAMKAAALNNPLNREWNLQNVHAEKSEDSFIFILLSTFIGPLFLWILLQIALLSFKFVRGNPSREEDVAHAVRLLERQEAMPEAIEEGPTLQELQERYKELQAEKDKTSVMVLCTGCSSSYFSRDVHKPCVSGAELIPDYDISALVRNDHRRAPNT